MKNLKSILFNDLMSSFFDIHDQANYIRLHQYKEAYKSLLTQVEKIFANLIKNLQWNENVQNNTNLVLKNVYMNSVTIIKSVRKFLSKLRKKQNLEKQNGKS